MEINIYMILIIFSSLIAAISQVLLKISANKKYRSRLYEYLNFHVITAYILLFSTLLLNIYAYRGVEYKIGAVLTSFSYIFVNILGTVIFKEKQTKRKIVGEILIIAGVIVYNFK